MNKTISYSLSGADSLFRLPLGDTLIRFMESDFDFFWEQCIEAASKYQLGTPLPLDQTLALRELVIHCHPYCRIKQDDDFRLISLDCMIDFICMSEGMSLEELWVNKLSAEDEVGKAIFSRISEYKTGNAINQWANLIRLKAYATAKAEYIFGADPDSFAVCQARKLYYDFAFRLAARELGCDGLDMPKTLRCPAPMMPCAPELFSNISVNVLAKVKALVGGRQVQGARGGKDCLRDQNSAFAVNALAGLKRPEYPEQKKLMRFSRNNPAEIFMPDSFKAIIDLEFDKLLENNMFLSVSEETGKYAVCSWEDGAAVEEKPYDYAAQEEADELEEANKKVEEAEVTASELRHELEVARREIELARAETEIARREAENAKSAETAAKTEAAETALALATARGDIAVAKLEAEKARGEADKAKQEAAAALKETELAREETERQKARAEAAVAEIASAKEEVNKARIEAEFAKSEAATAQTESESAKSETGKALLSIESARAEIAAANMERDAAKAEAEAAKTEAETAKAETERFRAQSEASQSAEAAAKTEADEAKKEAASARAEASSIRMEAEKAKTEAELAKAELEKVKKETESVRIEAERLKREAMDARAQTVSALADTEKTKREFEALRTEAVIAQLEAENARQEREKQRKAEAAPAAVSGVDRAVLIKTMAESPDRRITHAVTAKGVNARCQTICSSMREGIGNSLSTEEIREWFRHLIYIRRCISNGEMTNEDLEKYLDATEEVYGSPSKW